MNKNTLMELNKNTRTRLAALEAALAYHSNRQGNPEDVLETADTFLTWITGLYDL